MGIKTKTDRAKLSPNKEPYWERVQIGLHVGYRKLDKAIGTWTCRHIDKQRKKHYRPLGSIEDEGNAFDIAAGEAREWLASLDMGVVGKRITVADVCREYVKDRRLRVSADNANDAEGRFRRLVYGHKTGGMRLDKINSMRLNEWLLEQIDLDDDDEDIRRAKDSANRNLAALKAALNLARDNKLIASDAGWKTVKSFKGVGRRRTGFLTIDQRNTLLDHCPDDLRALVTALLLTGARAGELAKAVVGDFDKHQGTIALSGKTGHRICTLSSEARTLFAGLAKGKMPKAPLIARADGKHFDKDSWKKVFRQAVKAANLPPDTVLYTIRHVAITELVNSGMDSFVVAKLAGTSTAMIDKHYGQLRHDKTRASLDAVKML